MGRSIQQAYGQPPQIVLTLPLLTGIDGVQKMSKSVGNHIGITEPPSRDVRQDAARSPTSRSRRGSRSCWGRIPPAGLARHPTVAQLLARDDFAKRFAADEPISLLELLYPVLQGYDSVAVRADVELGGTDQTFNLLMGRQIQQAYGQAPQIVLTTPLLTGTDGVQKMSKSIGNDIGVTDPPGEMYGKTMRIPDEQIAPWFSLLLGAAPPRAGPRDAKRALARALVVRFHDARAAEEAEAGFDRVFIAHELPEAIEEATVRPENGTVHLPAVIAEAFGRSRSEARRMIAQGGVKRRRRAARRRPRSARSAVDGRVLQLGKRHFRRLRVI